MTRDELGQQPSIKPTTISRRRLIQASGGAAAAAAVGGRFGRAPAVHGQEIELTYWHGWTEKWEEMVQYVVDMFHAKQTRVRIKPQVVAWDQFLPKLTAAIAAGKPPDIVTLFGSTAIPTLASQGALVALNTLPDVDLAGIQAWVDPNVLTLGQYGDNLYGLSYWAGCNSLIYNKAVFTEVGLDAEVGPKTIAELDAMAAQLSKKGENGRIERMGFLPGNGDFWMWATVFGGSFYDAANQRITANDPKIVEALTWYQSYAKTYDARQVAAFTEGLASERAQQQDPLIAGKYALQVQGPWKLGDIRDFAPADFQYGVITPPKVAESDPLSNWTWGDIQLIPKGSKDPSAAAEFVQFTAGINDAEGYAKRVVWGDRPINVPVSRSVLEVPSFQQVVQNYPGFQTFIDSLLTATRVGSPPVMPAAAFYNDRLTSTLEEVMLLQTEPQAALDKLTEDVQKELDKTQG